MLPHTHLSLPLRTSLSLSIPLSHTYSLSISAPLKALTVREETEYPSTHTHSAEWRQHTLLSQRTQALSHTHIHTHAHGEDRRWTEAPAVERPLAAVRHVGGGALLAVPCALQSSKHLPSPHERSLSGSAVAEGLAGMT